MPHPSRTSAPLLMPVLSRGRHRTPRTGACFMEMASYLAGERWSDHPSCTHPTLAALARGVNDGTSDAGRGALAPLIPSVVGLDSEDPLLPTRLALLCATKALPVVAEERQRVMAVAALAADRVLARSDGRGPGSGLLPATREALGSAPLAAAWAQRFATAGDVSLGAHRRNAVPHVVASAAAGIARSCTPDPDALLRDLLVTAIATCRAPASGQVAVPVTTGPGRAAAATRAGARA